MDDGDKFGWAIAVIVFFIVGLMFTLWGLKIGPFKLFCEIDSNKDICQNNGTCISLSQSDYRCDGCDSGWKGKDCYEVDSSVVSERPCEKDKPCKHDSKCTDIDTTGNGIMNDYECECSNIDNTEIPWEGKDCNDIPQDLENDFDSRCDVNGVKRYGYKQCPLLNDQCIKDYDINCPNACVPPTELYAWCPDLDKCVNRLTGKSKDNEQCLLIPDNVVDDYDCSDVRCHRFSGSGTEDDDYNKEQKRRCKRHDDCCKWKNDKKKCRRRDRDGRRDRDHNYWRDSFVVGGYTEY